ncbi:aifB [Symbiodinium sp. CCMP2592]|nr:aifB [Symbiodinium sp. CCMP2592]
MSKPRVLVIGSQFSGTFCARELKSQCSVTVVDAKEYFEYTPGVLRAFVNPSHYDALSFSLQPVLERRMGVKYIWGEVKELDGDRKVANIKPLASDRREEVGFDYCIICSGCNFGPFKPMGESLWFPTVHEEAQAVSDWKHIDARLMRAHKLQAANLVCTG